MSATTGLNKGELNPGKQKSSAGFPAFNKNEKNSNLAICFQCSEKTSFQCLQGCSEVFRRFGVPVGSGTKSRKQVPQFNSPCIHCPHLRDQTSPDDSKPNHDCSNTWHRQLRETRNTRKTATGIAERMPQTSSMDLAPLHWRNISWLLPQVTRRFQQGSPTKSCFPQRFLCINPS